ncbi:MAG: DUF507 family protein [Myxococcota bacterium]
MKIYRRVIPKIAKDVVRTLLANQAIEVEDGHRDEAELDVAGVIVEYQNQVEKVNTDAREALERHHLGIENLGRIKRSLAENRKVVLGEEALDYVINRIIESLFDSRHIEEVFEEDNEIRKMVLGAMRKYLGVDEELDREVRGRLKNLREGTSEWSWNTTASSTRCASFERPEAR